jgi:hypothetical protein
MTEAEWLTGTELAAQVRFAANLLSPRRQRLLAVGFCRAVAHLFDHPDLTSALATIEWFADGRDPISELERARQRCRELALEAYETYARQVDGGDSGGRESVRHELAWAVAYAATSPLPVAEVGNRAAQAAAQAQTGAVLLIPVASTALDAAIAEQLALMRSVVWEVTGNPFRPMTFSPDWRTSTALALAHQMYESREFSAMPILADALQDAGCDNEELLAHCRDPHAKHLRGCWAVDGVLGKE